MNPADDPDVIDTLVAEWRRTRPRTRPEAMQIIGRIIRLGRVYEDEVVRLLRPHGLSYSDFDVLATLCRSGEPYEMLPTQLQRNVLLTSGAMTACLRRLEAAGLVERHAVDGDRRRLSAKLTPTGMETVETLIDRRFALADAAVEVLDSCKTDALATVLRQLAKATS